MNWHRLNIEETFEFLDTRQQGLTTPDAEGKSRYVAGPVQARMLIRKIA